MVQAHESETLVGRELLLDVACRLFMEDGYDGVSMQQIASAAHMTKGSPYYHFKGKEDLFIHAFTNHVQRMNDGFRASLAAEGPLRARLVTAFNYLLTTTDPGMIRMFDDYQRSFAAQCQVEGLGFESTPDIMHRAYQEMFAASDLGWRQSPDELAEALMAFQLGTLHMRVIHPHGQGQVLTAARAREIAQETIDLFLDGAIVTGG